MKKLTSLVAIAVLTAGLSVTTNEGQVANAAPMAVVSVKAETKEDPVRKPTYTPSRSRAYARTKVTATQYACLNKLWTRESNWNHKAANKTTTAYGIPQMLNMKTKNPYRQIQIGLRYIEERYGTPCEAWSFWKRHHWY